MRKADGNEAKPSADAVGHLMCCVQNTVAAEDPGVKSKSLWLAFAMTNQERSLAPMKA